LNCAGNSEADSYLRWIFEHLARHSLKIRCQANNLTNLPTVICPLESAATAWRLGVEQATQLGQYSGFTNVSPTFGFTLKPLQQGYLGNLQWHSSHLARAVQCR